MRGGAEEEGEETAQEKNKRNKEEFTAREKLNTIG